MTPEHPSTPEDSGADAASEDLREPESADHANTSPFASPDGKQTPSSGGWQGQSYSTSPAVRDETPPDFTYPSDSWGRPPTASPGGDYLPPPPGYGPPPGAYPPPPGGYYGQGTYSTDNQAWGAPPPPGSYSDPNFRPDLKPGIIPLRPLRFGEIFDGAFNAARSNPRVMFLLSAIVALVISLLGTLAWLVVGQTGILNFDNSLYQDSTTELTVNEAVVTLIASLLAGLISATGQTILVGMLTKSVSESVLGRTLSVGELWDHTKGRVGALIVNVLIVTAASMAVMTGGIALVLFALSGTNDDAGAIMALVLLTLLGLLVAVVVSWALHIKLLYMPIVIVLERVGPIKAFARSWQLTRGFFWRTTGIYLLVVIIVSVAAGLVAIPLQLLLSISFAVWPDLDPVLVSIVFAAVNSVITMVLTVPFQASATSLLYIDTRMRSEGLDIELAKGATSTP